MSLYDTRHRGGPLERARMSVIKFARRDWICTALLLSPALVGILGALVERLGIRPNRGWGIGLGAALLRRIAARRFDDMRGAWRAAVRRRVLERVCPGNEAGVIAKDVRGE
jgi:hypothetical protein